MKSLTYVLPRHNNYLFYQVAACEQAWLGFALPFICAFQKEYIHKNHKVDLLAYKMAAVEQLTSYLFCQGRASVEK